MSIGTGRPNTLAGKLAGRGGNGNVTEHGDVPGLQPEPPTLTVLHHILDVMTAIRQAAARTGYTDKWIPRLHTLPTGHSMHVASRNPARRRLQIWTDTGNTSAVWLGASPYSDTIAPSAGSGYVALAANSGVLELHTWGDVYAWSSSGGNVYVIEEFGA